MLPAAAGPHGVSVGEDVSALCQVNQRFLTLRAVNI
jgi:hypothetical protein